ncbi:MAG: CDP-diacylglycerol--serine O-phosphatidyltransferase [Campylobacterales bacterium]|nr:CDP-diacylglycerol--serine O-phosphatidyltransferase [Campylobacterales bacterium]
MGPSKDGKLQFIYLIPNLFTAASAFLGVIGVLASVRGQYETAAIYILLSLVFDGLDGRIARLTKTTSKFGAEFDSLADIVAFGVAPAMLFYFSVGHQFGRLGALLAALFVVFGAIRLARFNVMSSDSEPSVFIGVPIPTAAVVSAMWVLMYEKYPFMQGLEWMVLVGHGVLAFLMVSNVRYPSFKKLDFKKAHRMKVFVYLTVTFSLVYLYPVDSATFFVTLYLLYGVGRESYVFFVAKWKKNKYNT